MRFYSHNNILLPSVTTFLTCTESEEEKQHYALARQFAEKHEGSLERGQARGTYCHQQIERYLKHKIPIETSAEHGIQTDKRGLLKIQTLLDSIDDPIVEKTYFSVKLGFAGTVDLIFKKGKQTTVADFKTSRVNYDKEDVHFKSYQLASYALLHEATTGENIDRGLVLNWNVKNKTKGFLIFSITSLQPYKKEVRCRVKQFQELYKQELKDLQQRHGNANNRVWEN
jgi:hypothetical protein